MICIPVCGERNKNARSRLSLQKTRTRADTLRSGRFLPGVGKRAVRAVLLYVHAEKTYVDTVDLLEGEKCFGSVREALGHLVVVDKPGGTEKPLVSSP